MFLPPIALAAYGWITTPIADRKEMYLQGATGFAIILAICLGMIWAGEKIRNIAERRKETDMVEMRSRYLRRERLTQVLESMPDGPEKEALKNKLSQMEAPTDNSENQQPQKSVQPRRPRILTSRRIVMLGLMVFLAAGLFPPWNSVMGYKDLKLRRNLGFHSLFIPPEASPIRGRHATSAKIDFTRLGLEWALIAVATGGALYLRRRD